MLLRVFVVALGLTYLCDDPGLEEWEDVAVITTPDREESQRNGDGPWPDDKMAPAVQEVARRGTGDSGAFKGEGGDFLEGEGRAAATSHLAQGAKADGSLSPNQSGNAAGSRHQKNGAFVSKEQSPLSRLGDETSEKGPPEERDYFWCLWNAFSIFSVIHFIRKHLGKALQQDGRSQRVAAALPDSSTLERFHSTCVGVPSEKRRWETAFLEGLASDLLGTMRAVCDANMAIGDFSVADPRHIVVPLAPPEPYGFRCFLRENPAGAHVCGQIKVVETGSRSCRHCQLSDDVVCLLHCDAEPRTKPNVLGRFCSEASLLSKSQITEWFRSAVKHAWGVVSHKYEFQLDVGAADAPGALQVRFRSGKKVSFSMTPVVKFDADTHFLPSNGPGSADDMWTLSLGGYEDRFLKRITGNPSCVRETLEIALFLHRRQTALTGVSELKDAHFRMALMHLLLLRGPAQWGPQHLAHRLRDLLDFLEKSLEEKALRHVLVGDPSVGKLADVPAELTRAGAVNLFHPFATHSCLQRNAVKHLREILRNANVLIDDYVSVRPGHEGRQPVGGLVSVTQNRRDTLRRSSDLFKTEFQSTGETLAGKFRNPS